MNLALNNLQRFICCKTQPTNQSEFFHGGLRGVMVKVLDCGIVVHEFEPQSCYDVHFQTNTLGKGMNPLILPSMG